MLNDIKYFPETVQEGVVVVTVSMWCCRPRTGFISRTRHIQNEFIIERKKKEKNVCDYGVKNYNFENDDVEQRKDRGKLMSTSWKKK
jgi:hypothetical protein